MPHKIESRVTDTTKTQIDAIFTNTDNTFATGTMSTMVSDHYSPFVIIDNCKSPSIPEYITFRNTCPDNISKVVEELSKIEWQLEDKPINMAYNELINKINDIYNKHCPLKQRKVDLDKMALQPFMTQGLLVSRATKNKMIANYNRKRTPEKREKLREYVKLYKKICKASDLKENEDFIKANHNNSRKIWQLAKNRLGLNRLQDSLTNSLVSVDNKVINGDSNIANHLNEFFVNIGTDLPDRIYRGQ